MSPLFPISDHSRRSTVYVLSGWYHLPNHPLLKREAKQALLNLLLNAPDSQLKIVWIVFRQQCLLLLNTGPLYLLFLKREIKSCALAGQPFRPDCASVAVDNTPDRSQTDSRARIFFSIMQALKRSKYSLRVFHVEAGSVITNKIYFLMVFLC